MIKTVVSRQAGKLIARAPAATAGSIEVRGIGIVEVTHKPEAELVLVADLVSPGEVERLPNPLPQTMLLDVNLPCIRIAPFEASAPDQAEIRFSELPSSERLGLADSPARHRIGRCGARRVSLCVMRHDYAGPGFGEGSVGRARRIS